MEVKAGYKQSEIGMIPEDWEALPLPNTVWFQEGPGLRNWQFRPNGLKVINVTNLQGNGYLDLSTTERHISREECDRTYKHFLIDDGDVVVASSGNSYCKVAVVRKSDLPLLMNTSVIRFKAKTKISRSFMLTYLKSKYFKAQIDLMITGGAQPNFGPFHLRKVFIPSPPTKDEQEAIAEALSDADALIESLEQLLAKKHQLKQGAMQELLTGKQRLPGFSGKWEVKRLDELGRWTGGMTPSMRNPDYWQSGTVPWISSGDVKSTILTSTAFSISEYAIKRKATTLLPAKSIIVVTRSGILRKYLPVAMNMIPMAINQDIKALLPNDHALAEYLLHALTCNGERILARCLKSGTTVESVEFPWLKAFTVPIPPIAEQTAIAAILSDLDAEIAALDAKLAKARQLKQGMMQELLTGRIRLVRPSQSGERPAC